MPSFIDCVAHDAALALEQDNLLNCKGKPLPAGTRVATCYEMHQLVDQYVPSVLQDCNKVSLVKGVSLLTCAEAPGKLKLTINGHTLTIDGGNSVTLPDNDIQTLSVSGQNISISGGNTITIPVLHVVTLVKVGHTYVYTNEAGVQTIIDPATFISSDAGSAIAVGTDGGLKLIVPAQLPDDQVLGGDNSGTVQLTLTPTTQPDGRVDYLVKADLKVAATTPSGATNTLIYGPNGYYVQEATDALPGVVALNTGSNLPADTTNCVDALTACGFNAMASDTSVACGNPFQLAILAAVKQTIACKPKALQAIACGIANNAAALQCLKDKVPVTP